MRPTISRRSRGLEREEEAALASIWDGAGGSSEALGRVTLTGSEPQLPSSFKVGIAAQATLAAASLAASELWRLRSGEARGVGVDMRHAATEFRSERYLQVDGGPAPELWDRIAGIYQAGDGEWVRMHTNFPHHRDGMLALLGCAYERDAVAEALRGWRAEDLEEAGSKRGLCLAMMRRFEAWDAHPHSRYVAAWPLVEIERIGDSPPEPLSPAARPLSGLRVLDLTRVIAGPVAGRCLAAHGAEVLQVTAEHLPQMAPLVIDTGRGKRSCFLDLREDGGRRSLAGLLAGADVFLQSYRPGALAARGFGAEAVAALRPGIIHATLSAYGPEGPWGGRRGFDSLVQTATGFNHSEGAAAGESGPRALPCQALDHGSGYLLAFGIMRALARRAEEGGSWRVAVSLARTGLWLRGLGRQDALSYPDPDRTTLTDLMEESDTPFGQLSAVRHAGRIDGLPPAWIEPASPLGSHPPRWRSY